MSLARYKEYRSSTLAYCSFSRRIFLPRISYLTPVQVTRDVVVAEKIDENGRILGIHDNDAPCRVVRHQAQPIRRRGR